MSGLLARVPALSVVRAFNMSRVLVQFMCVGIRFRHNGNNSAEIFHFPKIIGIDEKRTATRREQKRALRM